MGHTNLDSRTHIFLLKILEFEILEIGPFPYYLYANDSTDKPENETVIYTWKDANLREILNCLKKQSEDEGLNKPGIRFKFALVYPEMRLGRYEQRHVGLVLNDKNTKDDLICPLNDI